MIPWDYNLAFGTFQGGNAQSTVNTPIDAPVSGGTDEDRPMWNWILSEERYTELYHRYFLEFLNTVDVQALIDSACSLIEPYVQKDPTAFYTYEEFQTGVDTMRQFCRLRSGSISMQLANGETTKDMGYVNASGLTISNMGSMGDNGGFGGGMPGKDRENFPVHGAAGMNPQGTAESAAGNAPQSGAMPAMPSRAPEGFGDRRPDMGGCPMGSPDRISGGTAEAPSDTMS